MVSDIVKSLDLIAAGYEVQLKEHGASPLGVLWADQEAQNLRFKLLAKVLEPNTHHKGLTINDLGCGYGAFFEFLKDMPSMQGGHYYGYDISEDMITTAKQRINEPHGTFLKSSTATQKADYSFASGTFNMKGTMSEEQWTQYVKESLLTLFSQSARGMAFNLLDKKKNERQEWLYYADAEEFVEYCRSNLSPNVELVDSHPLNDCTILVHKPTCQGLLQ